MAQTSPNLRFCFIRCAYNMTLLEGLWIWVSCNAFYIVMLYCEREYAGNAGEATGVTIDTEDDSFVAA